MADSGDYLASPPIIRGETEDRVSGIGTLRPRCMCGHPAERHRRPFWLYALLWRRFRRIHEWQRPCRGWLQNGETPPKKARCVCRNYRDRASLNASSPTHPEEDQ